MVAVAPAPRHHIADLAVRSLIDEALLTPKPGLVDQRGPGVHRDMNLALMLRSAESLRTAFERCAQAAAELPVGPPLRARIGIIGRRGEQRMLEATGGVNTHRGALWAVGLLAAGASRRTGAEHVVAFAARLAAVPDPGLPPQGLRPSNGEQARRRYGVAGAAGEARRGFPHVIDAALPTLHAARERGANESSARLDALLAVMASLVDTCLLHRGGLAGLAAVRHGAGEVLRAGGCSTPTGRRRFARLDQLMRRRRLSPGGSGDLLAAALFLDSIESIGGTTAWSSTP
jgi:triphosphoribosyl-dephospho-CoA synthase